MGPGAGGSGSPREAPRAIRRGTPPEASRELVWVSVAALRLGSKILEFVKDWESVILGVWAAPGAPETLQKGGGLRPQNDRLPTLNKI